MASEEKKVRRFNVNFAESTFEALEELAQRKGKTKAEILRDVIALAKYIDDVTREGGFILVERRGMPAREVVFR